ncbi:MAG: thioredoxin family protein [Chlamydiales bacterium]
MGRFFRFFFPIFCWSIPIFASQMVWLSDFEKGLEESRGTKKPLLLFFTGSDWSGWSMKLKDEVLSSTVFQQKIAENFVCVEIDFPLHTPPVGVNMKVKERLQVTEYPTVVLLNYDEREIARLGYLPITPSQYADDLLFALAQDRDLSYLLDLLARGEVTLSILERAYYLSQELCCDGAIELVLDYGIKSNDPGYFLVEKYRRLLSQGKGDLAEIASLRKQIEQLGSHEELYHLALIDFQALAAEEENQISEKVVAPLKHYLEQFASSNDNHKWEIEMMLAQFYLAHDKWGEALKHAQVAQIAAPYKHREEIADSLEYIKEKVEEPIHR